MQTVWKPEADLLQSCHCWVHFLSAFPLCAASAFPLSGSPGRSWGQTFVLSSPSRARPVLLLQVEASPPGGARSAARGSWRPWWACPTGVGRSWCSLGLPLGTSTSGRRPCCWGQWRPMMDLCLPCMPWTRYLSPSSTWIFVVPMDLEVFAVEQSQQEWVLLFDRPGCVSTLFHVLLPHQQLSDLWKFRIYFSLCSGVWFSCLCKPQGVMGNIHCLFKLITKTFVHYQFPKYEKWSFNNITMIF